MPREGGYHKEKAQEPPGVNETMRPVEERAGPKEQDTHTEGEKIDHS